MKTLKIEVEKLNDLLANFMEDNDVYIPVEEAFGFVLSSDPSEFKLNQQNTRKSIKEVFFPAYEPLLQYELKGKSVEVEDVFPEVDSGLTIDDCRLSIEKKHRDKDRKAGRKEPVAPPPENRKTGKQYNPESEIRDRKSKQSSIINHQSKVVLFGAKPCDAFSLDAIKRVFLQEPEDEFFKNKLDRTHVLSFACEEPDEACFCTSIHQGPTERKGSDLLFVNVDGNFLVEVVTEKGSALLESSEELFDSADDEDMKALSETVEKYKRKVKKVLRDATSLPEQLDFDSPLWKDTVPSCIGCGICAFLCPTCHCFDIQDEGNRLSGERTRIWDACTFFDFTKMAATQPRLEHYRRYRQRLMHKFKYYPELFGTLLCTGCGRCIRYCPMGIDMVEVLDRMRGEENA